MIIAAQSAPNGELHDHDNRGEHAREDFPNRDDVTWMKHTLAFADDAKKTVNLGDRPVHTFTMSNEIEYIKPKARVY